MKKEEGYFSKSNKRVCDFRELDRKNGERVEGGVEGLGGRGGKR